MMTPKPIDHLVLPVAGLAQARERLTALGFTVAADAHHPFGTGNSCVFFADRNYLEPITVIDAASVASAKADGNAFVHRVASFLERNGEGMAILAIKSDDAGADLARYHRHGLADGDLFAFSRRADRQDGTSTEIGVHIGVAADPQAPDAAFMACQHRDPEALYAGGTTHANTATGIVGAAMCAPNPSDFQYLLEQGTGDRDLRATSLGIEAQVPGATIAVLTPLALQQFYGDSAGGNDADAGLRWRAFALGVSDLGRCRQVLGENGVSYQEVAGRIVVPPAPGLAAAIAFTENVA